MRKKKTEMRQELLIGIMAYNLVILEPIRWRAVA